MEYCKFIQEELIKMSSIKFSEIDIYSLVVYTITAILLFLIYNYVILPLDWKKELGDVGFGHLKKKDKSSINLLRRQRKIGNIPPIYPNGWFVILESDQLKKEQVVPVEAIGKNLVVFRDTSGKSHVLDAYCPHLGANLGIGGTVRGDCIECPFHGWKFRGSDGQCTQIPYADKVPEFAKVQHWTSCEVNHLIFVWFHAEGEEPEWYPEPRENIENGEWIYRGRNEFYVNSHIQEIPENGGDVAHLNVLHSTSALSGSDLRNTAPRVGTWQSMVHVWDASWEPCTEKGRKHESKLDLKHSLNLFGKLELITMKILARQIGPGYVILDMFSNYGQMTILQYVTPVGPLLQKVVHRIYCPWKLSLVASLVLVAESIMIERDIMVWNSKAYLEKPMLVKEDRALARHRRWYNQFYSENSPKYTFQSESIDW